MDQKDTEKFKNRPEYSFDDLCGLTELLRSPDGCPWDRAQDHKSIRKNLLEEAYEVCETIDNDDAAHMCEELGDLLLQVVFHAQLEKERARFTIDDVTSGICRKLVYRHPHIFGDAAAAEGKNADDALDMWEQLKRREKGYADAYDAMRGVSCALPSLMRAQKLISKARKYGFEIKLSDRFFACSDAELSEILLEVCAAAAERGLDTEELLAEKCDDLVKNAEKC